MPSSTARINRALEADPPMNSGELARPQQDIKRSSSFRPPRFITLHPLWNRTRSRRWKLAGISQFPPAGPLLLAYWLAVNWKPAPRPLFSIHGACTYCPFDLGITTIESFANRADTRRTSRRRNPFDFQLESADSENCCEKIVPSSRNFSKLMFRQCGYHRWKTWISKSKYFFFFCIVFYLSRR